MPADPAPTAALAAFASRLRFEALPAEVVARLKLLVLDALGCGLHGSTTPEGRLVAELALDWSSKDEATIWGQPRRTAAANAALANATATQAFTFDDVHLRSGSHPGACAVPPGLALAERLGGVDGRRLLAALAAGYEVGCRVAAAAMPAARLRGFHPVGVFGTLGAAATCANLLGLDERRALHALGTAGTQGAGLMAAQFDSMVHRFHAGKAAQAGLISAALAAGGFRGVTDLLEAPYGGLYSSLAGQAEAAARAVEGLGEAWAVLDVALRPYACAASATTAVDGVRDLRREHGFEAGEVEGVTVRASELIRSHCGHPYVPSELIAAQINIPYGVAVALLDGTAGVEQYAPERLADTAVLAMAARVRVEHEPAYDESPPDLLYRVAVEVALTDGRRLALESRYPRGSRARPLSPAEVAAKFRGLAGMALDVEQVERIVEAVGELEALEDVRRLGDLLRPEAAE